MVYACYVFVPLIDMTPGELQFLSSHLGHDVSTHKNKYRIHSTAVEITKVGKLLMAVDSGDTRYSGRRMNMILEETDVEPVNAGNYLFSFIISENANKLVCLNNCLRIIIHNNNGFV